MNKKLLIGCGVPVLVVMVGASWGLKKLMHVDPKPDRTETVKRGDVEIKVIETGTIEPLTKVELKSQVGGRLSKMLVEEGDRVRKGQVMALIDPVEINAQVAALAAQLKGSRARLSSARKNVTFQRDTTSTSIDQYIQNAAAAAAHLKEAESDATVQPKLTQETIVGARANLDAANATLKALRDSLDLMVQTTNPQNVVSAQAAYDQAKVQADNSDRNAVRQRALFAKGYIAKQVTEQADTDAEVADAHLKDVKLKVDQVVQSNKLQEANMRSQIANAEGLVRQQESALAQAEASVLPADKAHELASARAALAQANAQVAAARAGRTQDQMRLDDVAAAEADVSNYQGQLDNLLVQQHECTIYASMAGVVTKKYSEPGELVTSAIASFGSGTSIYQVADLSTMLIKINVNEVDISKLKPGLLTEVTSDSCRGALFVGKIRKVAPSAASSDPSSGGASTGGVIRFPVEIQIDRADSRLRPGMSARCAMIVARRRNVLRLPSNCIATEKGKSSVQIVTSTMVDGKPVQKTEKRSVTIGLTGDDFVEVTSGVKEGELVQPNPYSGPPRKEIDITIGGGDNKGG